jgi:hypothetical protein
MRAKRAGRVAQVVEYLPRKHEALSSKSIVTKKKENKYTKQKLLPYGVSAAHHQHDDTMIYLQ